MRTGRRRRADDGYTLVELIVSMGVASILLVAIGVVFVSVTSGVRTLNVKTATTADARIVMEAMTRALRVAYKPASKDSAIEVAKAGSVTFYALLNRTGVTATTTPDPTKVTFAYDGTCISQTLIPARILDDESLAWDTGASTVCLARTSQAPVFSYFTSGQATTPLTIPAAGSLLLTDLKTVNSLQMEVYAQDPNNIDIAAVPLVDRVTMTNLGK